MLYINIFSFSVLIFLRVFQSHTTKSTFLHQFWRLSLTSQHSILFHHSFWYPLPSVNIIYTKQRDLPSIPYICRCLLVTNFHYHFYRTPFQPAFSMRFWAAFECGEGNSQKTWNCSRHITNRFHLRLVSTQRLSLTRAILCFKNLFPFATCADSRAILLRTQTRVYVLNSQLILLFAINLSRNFCKVL